VLQHLLSYHLSIYHHSRCCNQPINQSSRVANTIILTFGTMVSNIIVARTVCRSLTRGTVSASNVLPVRTFSSAPNSSISRKKKNSGYTFDEPMHPNYSIDSVKPPKYWEKPEGELHHVNESFLLCNQTRFDTTSHLTPLSHI
jgi:hypothetical protein